MTDSPRFTVIIPLYNHEAFIGEAIRSVLEQTIKDFELIVMDDGSTDHSYEVAEAFNDPRIRLFRQDNQGCAKAINHCLELAKGDTIAILNSDDAFEPTRLEEASALLDLEPSLSAVFSNISCIDESSQMIRSINVFQAAHEVLPIDATLPETTQMVLRLLSGNFLHSTSNLVCRKVVFNVLQGFQSYRYVQDQAFFLRLAAQFNIKVIDQPLLRYRYHDQNTLRQNPSMSVLENTLMLTDFMRDWRLPPMPDQDLLVLLEYLVKRLGTFGGDRLLACCLALTLVNGHLPSALHGPTDGSSDPAIDRLKRSIDLKLGDLRQELSWQNDQTNQWWSRTQLLEENLNWQKLQTDHWWAQHQMLEAQRQELVTQLQRSENKYQENANKISQLEIDKDWQSEQTTLWWTKSKELEQELLNAKRISSHLKALLSIPFSWIDRRPNR